MMFKFFASNIGILEKIQVLPTGVKTSVSSPGALVFSYRTLMGTNKIFSFEDGTLNVFLSNFCDQNKLHDYFAVWLGKYVILSTSVFFFVKV